jgi:hypothetical protein
MFVRFRKQGRRLQASLMLTRRVAGKMHTEHIASLGSVDAEVSVRERLAFWAKLPERLARLGNRVGPEEHAKIYGALHAHIPMVTAEEQRAVQGENAMRDERFWDTMLDIGTAGVEEHKKLIAVADKKIAGYAAGAAEAAERLQAAKDRLERLDRGESVSGGLGKPIDVEQALRKAGWTTKDVTQALLLASLTEEEMVQLNATATKEMLDANNRATTREARRLLRARRDAKRQHLTEQERLILRILESDLRRQLTDQEVEQVRAIGLI